MQNVFLHSPGFDFAEDELVGIAAIHHVDDLKPAEFLAGMAELTNDRPVQFQLVDLTRDGPRTGRISVRVRIRCEYVLVRPLRNTDRPADSEIVVGLDRFEIVVEDLVSDVGAVGDPDVALAIDLETVR